MTKQVAGYPLAPMVLGAILGSMVDENLRRALVLFEHQPMALFARPLGLALLVLILFTLYDGLYRARRVPRPVDNRYGTSRVRLFPAQKVIPAPGSDSHPTT